MPEYQFTLNGEARRVTARHDSPLLYIIRALGVFSPQYGCGKEQCGACKVLVDGKPAYSCTTTVEEADGTTVVTVEGLNRQHPLQQTLLDTNAGQCGFCLSGILMSAISLLEDNQNPQREEIQTALEGHLCRCGAHNRIIDAILLAAGTLRDNG